ncbi:MAG: RHS repeat protein [Verrucomicrobia bacterium]|nr:MAG: RHS repeat protein [Verrucomicrobiota bacterium]
MMSNHLCNTIDLDQRTEPFFNRHLKACHAFVHIVNKGKGHFFGLQNLRTPSHAARFVFTASQIFLSLFSIPAQAEPAWEKPSLSLGALDINGGLRQRFELGVLSGSPEFAFPIYLEHRLREEESLSEFQIPQLESYVVPEGREEILWLEPGGLRHVFKLADVKQHPPTAQKELWVAVKVGATDYQFHSADGWVYHYSAGGITSLLAPTGRKLLFETDGLRISRIYQESAGKRINLLASKDNDLGQPESVQIGPNIHRFQYTTATDQLASWKSPQMGLKSVSFSYSANGLIEAVTLPNSQKLAYAWGHRDGGETTEFFGVRGSSENRLESIRDARGRETVKMTYDTKGRMKTKQSPGTAEIRFEYDDRDRIIHIYRLEDLQKSYEYLGDSDKPVKITNALGDTIEIAYNAEGQVSRYKNLEGAVNEFTYDDLGQLTVEQFPLGYQKTIERDDFGRVLRIREIDGKETRYTYTDDDRLESVSENGSTWTYQYDPEGHLTHLLKDGATWQKTEREKIAATGEEILKQTDSRGDETVIQFDKAGNMVKQVDALGQKTHYKHDALGQITGWEDDRGAAAVLQRDAEGAASQVSIQARARACKWLTISRGKSESATTASKIFNTAITKKANSPRSTTATAKRSITLTTNTGASRLT